ncbi:hypothetical protein KIN20_010834 [Parelaphostrongylus tenuis]|uniref:Reverse transcriptase domain-containing protein n=1 Tax=Parelaphostrongylus tenuis TaxID=148309 RepID=A0AAD5MUJ1_PARTN|nr:hypothetical protein KIN20_010834 [Parelaphostrongylus tenuis]
MFADRLRNAKLINTYVIETFDATALYTNVSNDSALQATHELLIQHQGAMVREILCSNERAGNVAATGT